MAEQPIRKLPDISLKFQWRDLLALDMRDMTLRAKSESFLNLFERSAFPYQREEAGTGRIFAREVSGQDYLQRISELKDTYDVSSLSTILTSRGMMRGGKFIIADHARPYDGLSENGAAPIWMGAHKPNPFPIGIEIGTDYLKSGRVSVDAALTSTLTQLAFQSRDEDHANEIAGVVVNALGGARGRAAHFNETSGGYVSFADKFGKGKAELAFQIGGEEIAVRPAAPAAQPEDTPAPTAG